MKYVTYKIRWLILFGIFIICILRQMAISAFAMRNSDVAEYFNASPYQVDVLSVGDAILGTFTCLVLSVIGRHVGVRKQCLVLASFITVGSCLVSVGFTSRNGYACVALGRVLTGVAVGVLYILPGAFANSWFPSSQVGTAFCATFVGFNFGGVTSSLIFSLEFPTTVNSTYTDEESQEKIANVGSLFSTVFAVSTAILLSIAIVFWFFAKDKPPSPPSEAEALLLASDQEKPAFHLQSDVMYSIELLQSRPFILLSLGNFFCTSALVILLVLMPSLISSTFPERNLLKTISYVSLSAFAAACCLAFITGRILDRTRSYKAVCCGGSLMAATFAVGVCLGHQFKSLIALCIFYPIMFVSRISTITAFVEFLVETTYPSNKTVLISLHFAFYNAAYFIMTSIERALFHASGQIGAAVVPIFGNVLGCLCAYFVEPKYRRTEANAAETIPAN